MRITTVIGDLSGGGAERVCVNLANAWSASTGGHRVTLLTVAQNSSAPAYDIDPRVERRDIGWPRDAFQEELNHVAIAPVIRGLHLAGCTELIWEIKVIAMLRYAILATVPDVVVAHMDVTNLRALAALHETGVPVIACVQTDPERIFLGQWQSAREILYRRAPAVVAPDPTIAQWLGRSGIAAYSIPNPLVAPVLMHVDRKGDRLRVVTLARLSHEKRIDLLIRAFASIAGDFPEWDLDIYGTGPLCDSLERLAHELTSAGRIQFHGFITNVYEALTRADLFASSSWVEGFGNAIWEALACGVPVVAMDAGASVRSLVRDGIDGLIVRPDTASALGSALASLMGNQTARKTFAARAPDVLTRFSIDASLQSWDTLLAKVTAQSCD